MKIVFVSNYVPHYRIGLFEYLHNKLDIQFYFYSKGDEWYWQKQHGVFSGNFNHAYLPGFRVGNTAISFSLIKALWTNSYDIYIKCITGRFALPLTYIIARLKKKPFILWTGIWNRIQTPSHKLFFFLTRYFYTHADAVVVYGNHVKRFLIDLGVEEEHIFLAPQAVDNEAYTKEITTEEKGLLLDKFNIPKNKKVVLFLGRLVEIKALPLLVEAYSRMDNLSDTVLVLAGTGPEEEKIKILVKDLKLEEYVRFTGYIPTSETVPYYSMAWVSVLNSMSTAKEKETWGNTINESFNQGVPVITTNAVGAAVDGFVQNEVNGIVIPERNVPALTAALDRIVIDVDLRKKLSNNAKDAVKYQDYERMGSGFLQAINYVSSKSRK